MTERATTRSKPEIEIDWERMPAAEHPPTFRSSQVYEYCMAWQVFFVAAFLGVFLVFAAEIIFGLTDGTPIGRVTMPDDYINTKRVHRAALTLFLLFLVTTYFTSGGLDYPRRLATFAVILTFIIFFYPVLRFLPVIVVPVLFPALMPQIYDTRLIHRYLTLPWVKPQLKADLKKLLAKQSTPTTEEELRASERAIAYYLSHDVLVHPEVIQVDAGSHLRRSMMILLIIYVTTLTTAPWSFLAVRVFNRLPLRATFNARMNEAREIERSTRMPVPWPTEIDPADYMDNVPQHWVSVWLSGALSGPYRPVHVLFALAAFGLTAVLPPAVFFWMFSKRYGNELARLASLFARSDDDDYQAYFYGTPEEGWIDAIKRSPNPNRFSFGERYGKSYD